jgi:putative intracellular protease/amidase
LALGTASLAGASAAQAAAPPVVAALVHDDMVMLDLAGPMTVFGVLGARVVLVGGRASAVRTDIGVPVAPAATFADAPAAPDVLFLPGGLRGSVDAMRDPASLDWLRRAGAAAGHVTSVCTGGLVLGAAGLDFGLILAARLRGEEAARRVQLVLEHDPRPPFSAGSPAGAGPTLTEAVLRARGPLIAEARAAALTLAAAAK